MTDAVTTRRPQVLVVDDEEALVEIMREALEEEGFEVMAFTSITEAERALAHFRPDVVVADVYFPEGPCWPFIASLRWLQPAPAVVIMSAFGAAFGERERALGDAVLAKPFRLGVLINVIKRLVTGRRPPEEASPSTEKTATDHERLDD